MDLWIWQRPGWPRFRLDHERLLGPVGKSHRLLGQLYQQVTFSG
jgi:hypothetical protein